MGYRVAIAGRSNADSTPLPYDEMLMADGRVRPHYKALDQRVATLGDQELADRQRTLERFFLLQGITFTVYGGESSTERIIPTDLLPRIIPAEEWAVVEAGLTQRLRALNCSWMTFTVHSKFSWTGSCLGNLFCQPPLIVGKCRTYTSLTRPMPTSVAAI